MGSHGLSRNERAGADGARGAGRAGARRLHGAVGRVNRGQGGFDLLRHEHGGEARARARSRISAGVVGAVVMWWREAYAAWLPYPHLPMKLPLLPFKIKGIAAMQWTWFFDTSLVLMAAGGIMGWRSAWS